MLLLVYYFTDRLMCFDLFLDAIKVSRHELFPMANNEKLGPRFNVVALEPERKGRFLLTTVFSGMLHQPPSLVSH